jgi:uncharacterized protein (DUF2141 family)
MFIRLLVSNALKLLRIILLLVLCGFLQKPGIKLSGETGKLTVVMSNFKNDVGQVSVALFNQEEAFPKYPEKALRLVYSTINQGKATVLFDKLPPGEYAVSIYHDENSNKKMDTNFFGIPKEGVGASNNAKGHFGPPKFKDARFTFDGNAQTIQIEIVYL